MSHPHQFVAFDPQPGEPAPPCPRRPDTLLGRARRAAWGLLSSMSAGMRRGEFDSARAAVDGAAAGPDPLCELPAALSRVGISRPGTRSISREAAVQALGKLLRRPRGRSERLLGALALLDSPEAISMACDAWRHAARFVCEASLGWQPFRASRWEAKRLARPESAAAALAFLASGLLAIGSSWSRLRERDAAAAASCLDSVARAALDAGILCADGLGRHDASSRFGLPRAQALRAVARAVGELPEPAASACLDLALRGGSPSRASLDFAAQAESFMLASFARPASAWAGPKSL